MSTMKVIRGLILALMVCCPAVLKAEHIHFGFDSPAAVKSLWMGKRYAPLSFCSDKKVAGKGSMAIESILDGNLFKLDFPKNSFQGVVTFWLFDPLFSGKSKFRMGFGIVARKLKNGKPGNAFFSFDQGRESQFWYMHSGNQEKGGINTFISRHPGWTRLDIVNPKGKTTTVCYW